MAWLICVFEAYEWSRSWLWPRKHVSKVVRRLIFIMRIYALVRQPLYIATAPKYQYLYFFRSIAKWYHSQEPAFHVTGVKQCTFQWLIYIDIAQLECGTWYHHPRRLQCVWSRSLRIFKVATWHYRFRHNLKNNCIWDNLQCCLLVPRSQSKPVMLTFDLQSRKV